MTKQIVNELLDLLESQRNFVTNVEKLTDDQLNWIPKGSKNSIGILLDHISGAEKMLIHKLIFGIEITRDRDQEFEQKKRSLKPLLDSYQETANQTKQLLSTKLEDENLLDERMARGTKRTVLWALAHALDHNNYHIGQINLLLAIVDPNKEN